MRSGGRLKGFLGSVRFRLLAWGTLILVIVLGVFSSIVYYRQVEYQKAVLMGRVQGKASFIQEAYRNFSGETGGRQGLALQAVFPDQLPDLLKKPVTVSKAPAVEKAIIRDDEFVVVAGSDGRLLDWAGNIAETDIAGLGQIDFGQEVEGSLFGLFSLPDPESKHGSIPYLIAQIRAPLSDSLSLAILVGTPLDPDGQLSDLAWSLFLASLVVLGLSLVGGYYLAGRLMQPVQAITRTAREINADDLARRLNLGKQDELGELADTFDLMLDRLEDALKRQRQFAADASHELRTPLTIINLETSRLLEDPSAQPEALKSLAVIWDENERMIHLVNNLLVLARADAGSSRLKQEILDLSELTLEVVERLIPLSQRRAVTLTTGEMPPLPVRGDRLYLSQMASNLIENAIKHGAGEERRVWIETGCQESGPQRIGWLHVEDHGPGIAAEHLPHLFDRFYRVDPARSGDGTGEAGQPAESDGHGLGLSIVQWVARAHGGDVRVTSQVGKGAIFEVVLPLAVNGSGRIGTPLDAE